MHWVYLSPHLDDVALSCGGLIWEQAQSSESVRIITICAGDPPAGVLSPFAQSLHDRWQAGPMAMAQRRQEDRLSGQILGAGIEHLAIPDCVYRQDEESGEHLYTSEESLFGPIHPAEKGLMAYISQILGELVPGQAKLVCPLALGGHVDHKLTRGAAEKLNRELWYYADFPYAQKVARFLQQYERVGWRWQNHPISADGLTAWQDAIAAHASQISTFWSKIDDMRRELAAYREEQGGIRLWMPPPNRIDRRFKS